MARKSKARTESDNEFMITYTGDVRSVGVSEYTLPRGVAVPVREAVAQRFADHPDFEVTRGDVHES